MLVLVIIYSTAQTSLAIDPDKANIDSVNINYKILILLICHYLQSNFDYDYWIIVDRDINQIKNREFGYSLDHP